MVLRRLGRLGVCLVSIGAGGLALIGPAAAEVGGVTVVVRVISASGIPVARAAVRAQCPEGREWRTTADSQGLAVLANLGACALSVSVAGPRLPEVSWTAPQRLLVGETVTLSTRGCAVSGSPDPACRLLGQIDTPSVTSRFEETSLARDLPSGRTPWSFLEGTEPAAILDRIDGPGLYRGEPGRFSMRGASWTQNTILLDGLDITDPLGGGTPLLFPSSEAFESIGITSALAPVEYGAPGVTLALVPRQPTSEWRGSLSGAGVAQAFQTALASARAPALAHFGSLVDAQALVSGPLAGERLRVLFAADGSDLRRYEDGRAERLRAQVGSLLGRAVYRHSSTDALDVLGALQLLRRPLAARARFAGPAPEERVSALAGRVRWERTGERRSWSFFGGVARGSFEPQTAGLTAEQPVERLLSGPLPGLVQPDESRRTSWGLGGTLALRESRLGALSHAPRFGFSATSATSDERLHGAVSVAELVDGLPARIWDFGASSQASHRRVTDLVAYAADRLTWGQRLTLEAGVRFDGSRGRATGAAQDVQWATFSPRLSARLRLTQRGAFTVLGGYGEYRHRLLLGTLAFGDPAGLSGTVSRWNDRNGDRRYDASERGLLIARLGPGLAGGAPVTIDPGLEPPRTREWVVGLEGRSAGGLKISLTGFHRRESQLLESENVGVPLSAYRVTTIPDPAGDISGSQDDQLLSIYERRPASFGQDAYLLTNPADHSGLHEGAEVRVEKQVGQRFFLLAGATAMLTEARGANRGFRVSENDQGLIGELFDDPHADQFAKGRSVFDRAFTIKIASSYHAPGDLRASVVTRYQDGQVFNRFVLVPGLAQGPDLVPAIPRGQIERGWAKDDEGRYIVPSGHRFEYLLTLDARLEKGFRLAGERRLALFVEGFNLLDFRHEVEEYVVWNERFRTPTLVQPPLVFRLGARLDF